MRRETPFYKGENFQGTYKMQEAQGGNGILVSLFVLTFGEVGSAERLTCTEEKSSTESHSSVCCFIGLFPFFFFSRKRQIFQMFGNRFSFGRFRTGSEDSNMLHVLHGPYMSNM